MHSGLLKTLALSVALATLSPSVLAANLNAGAVAAPDQYGAKVAAPGVTRSMRQSPPLLPWP